MKVLIVVDMQKDFVDGALGSEEAVAIVPKVSEKIEKFDGKVIFTRDTHQVNYLETQEGKNLPVEHCIEGTAGWQICKELEKYAAVNSDSKENNMTNDAAMNSEKCIGIVNKPTFGSVELCHKLDEMYSAGNLESVELVGLCTDICVISNAMIIKAFMPELPIVVDASCCAGVTPESHAQALGAMKGCQITVINE